MAAKKTAAILVCAGSGARMKGSCSDKLLLEVAGKPVAAHAIAAFDQAEGIDAIIIVTRAECLDIYRSFKEKYQLKKEVIVVLGGATRKESVLNGVRAAGDQYEFVAIADGARPLIRPAEIRQTLEAAWESGAAALGAPITDTVKEIEDHQICRTIPRDRLIGIQTPQIFCRSEYLLLAEQALAEQIEFTDDASIYEYYNRPVTYVAGRRDNWKITTSEDITILQALMEGR